MTKQIPLTQGRFALVDDEDFEHLNKWNWFFNNGYAKRVKCREKIDEKYKQVQVLMHRVINQTPDGFETDHIDGDKLNNQKYNLRTATRSQNSMNSIGKKRYSSSSKYKGVDFHQGKWRAVIRGFKKQIYIGHFSEEIEAAKAYNKKAIDLFGKFAKLN